ncbi:uncharacterized protein LOC126979766 [Leptidea sinapis]|uniref:uncharacterized protein LOC126973613 n=2 Tax=Leptidea sinapis TaxID=189913 RepID=UPI0021C47F64|nr:uncharacterized protein LOC126973613 [Leptidea sinapis]XP_050676908.1 uncharacterized protein LOC126973614 [Leptidea sinapis]XP_050680387.1 uncharacterized protein LOC126976183 [Leptidea sinapis]XP_050685246.1 uncharacterized protein LOC126979766 [Leptidea sinapis]
MDVVVLYWYYRRLRRRKPRRYWIHPLLRQRFCRGAVVRQLKEDESKFFTYFRMTTSTFDDLLKRLEKDLKKKDTNWRKSLCPEVKLAIFLRYAASGCTFQELHYVFRVGVSTISNIIKEVTRCIWNNLNDEFMRLPTTVSEWEHISNGFDTKANFPHCLGAVDGKHIRLRKPAKSGSMYLNYKDFFSIILLAIVDSDYRFLYVSIGSYGKECDSSIFKESTFWKMMLDGSLQIPEPCPLITGSETRVPYVIIGDEGFGLHENLMRPFSGTHLDVNKRIYNYRLTRARRYVECAFGILANKWRVFHRPLDVNKTTAIWIVKACTVLHNFIREKEGLKDGNTSESEAFHFNSLPDDETLRGGRTANSVRTEFENYFVSESGSVSWQNEAI